MSEKITNNRCEVCGYVMLNEYDGYSLKPGTVLNDRFYIGNIVGQGGFGITYVGYDLKLELKVAIKEYFPVSIATRKDGYSEVRSYSGDKEGQFRYGLDKFLEEAKILAKFNQKPGIVSVMDYFEGNGTGYLIMEFLEGISLEKYLVDHGGSVDVSEARRITLVILDGLMPIHTVGIIHRDISPDNVFITDDGQIKILDLGAARHALSEKTNNLTVILKRGYAPAEQYSRTGNQGSWTDVYSVGATWYELLTGQKMVEALGRSVGETYKLPSEMGIEITPEEEGILIKALAYKPEDRYKDAGSFSDALNKIDFSDLKVRADRQTEQAAVNLSHKDKQLRGISRDTKKIEIVNDNVHAADDKTVILENDIYNSKSINNEKKNNNRKRNRIVAISIASVFALVVCVALFMVVRNIWLANDKNNLVVESNEEEVNEPDTLDQQEQQDNSNDSNEEVVELNKEQENETDSFEQQEQGDNSNGTSEEDVADFFILLDPLQSDRTTTILGRTGDLTRATYVLNDAVGIAEGEINFYQEGEYYYYKYRIGDSTYPTDYALGYMFEPGEELEIRIFSSDRVDADDISGFNLNIINETDMVVNIVYYSEDFENPRFTYTSIGPVEVH